MDARAVARVPLDVDLPAAHGVARRVADAAVDDDRAVVHRVADGVLCVAVHDDFSAVQIRAQRVAGHARDREGDRRHARRDEPLPTAVRQLHRRLDAAQAVVECLVIQMVCINRNHIVLPPLIRLRARRRESQVPSP